ncbi:MAG: MarR family transcriptional regulator [Gammaproteobacteria bacterium]|nr:MarR family transcriptional regulator [Gammaproteobacteria bacterium]
MSSKPTPGSTPDCPFYSSDNYEWNSSTGFLVGNLHHSLRRALDIELASFGDVSSAQWLVLMILSHHDDVMAANLAKRLNYDPGSMTRLLDRLQDKGLIQRTRLDDDRRCIRIELTEAGRTLAPQLPTAAISAINKSLTGFTAEEHQLLNSLLRRMIDNLKESP